MIEYDINKGEMKGQARLVLAGTIISEDEDGYEGETAIISSDEGVTTLSVLHTLARLIASAIKNNCENKQELVETLGYIINITADILFNDMLD